MFAKYCTLTKGNHVNTTPSFCATMDEYVNTSILKLNLEIPNFQAYFLPELLSFDVNAQIYFYSNRYKDSSLCMVT